MRRIAPLITGGAALAALASPALAQNTATATATGSATIIQALTISKTSDLGFGTIVKPTGAANNTVVVTTGGGRSISGSGNATALSSTSATAAAFLVQGEGAQHFSVSLPGSFNMTSGTNSLVVTTSNNLGGVTTAQLSGSIGAQGSLTLAVGGSFVLASSTVSGAYQGSLVVSVSYN
jgi:Domain of unknown function (DUF4402)